MGLRDAGVSLLPPPLEPLDETWSCVVVGVQWSQHSGIPVARPGWESGPFPQNHTPDCQGLLAPGWSLHPPLPTVPSSQRCSSPGPQMSLGHHKVHLLVAVGISLDLHHPPATSHGKAPVSPSPAQATSGMTQIHVLMEELLPEHLDGLPVPSSLLLHCHRLQLCAGAKVLHRDAI